MNSGAVVWAMLVTALLLTLPTTAIGVTLVALMLLGMVSAPTGGVGLLLAVAGVTAFYVLYGWFTDPV